MDKYHKTIVVEKDDLDELDHVNNVRYVQWIQDISKEHWLSSASEQMQEGIMWVVMNHNITYKSAAKLGDVIDMKTYIAESRGATSIRIVEMYDATTNHLLVQSTTQWCLLNSNTLRPVRISKEIKDAFVNEDRDRL
ncbi:acyl-CoA thioesterase [Pareuzebyella sediminis]|uniref:acyl-CoA thioesterase n=1 Tax=Pareuzebyella sediminis TaxID=2607998 RepID=UPI0011ECA8C7|nr:thioesterase family protein [Pareuzebyella sediminis]